MVAAVALGDLTFDQVTDCVPVAASYQPDPAAAPLYDGLFREFTGLYKRNRKAHARLNADVASHA
jgi:xylulokinase